MQWNPGLAVVLAAGLSACRGDSQRAAPAAAAAGFRDHAAAAGIGFRTHHLPNEQGERFRINLYDHGAGLAVGDFDNDGREDVYFIDQHGHNALYRNTGDSSFSDVTVRAGVGLGDRIAVAATFADYDNDGWADLFVTSTRGGNVLWHNRGDGTFADVTRAAGVGHVGHSQAAAFFDYDNDGLLDLFVTNSARWTTDVYDTAAHYFQGKADLPSLMTSPIESNILYRNRGDGTFTDVTARAGLGGRGWAGDVAVFDYDEDGFLDLFVPSMFGRGQLYRNTGRGAFQDVTAQTLGRTPNGAIGCKVLDYDGDGRLDLFVVDMHSDMWMGLDASHASLALARATARRRFRSPEGPTVNESMPGFVALQRKVFARQRRDFNELLFGNALYRNLGQGRFAEQAVSARLETFWPWGAAAGDFDGDVDLFIPSGMGYPFYYWPNQLMMNNGDATFDERGAELGIEPPAGGIYLDSIGGQPAARSSRAAAVADFDGDGRLDIMTNNFNGPPYFFLNRFPQQHWAGFHLTGSWSNRDAIGARVRLWAGTQVMIRQVEPASGYLAHSSRRIHFGLGDRTTVDSVEIRWPRGLRQLLRNPGIDALHRLQEPARSRASP